MKFYHLTLALCFVCFASASTQGLSDNDRLCAGFNDQGNGCGEYLDRCEESRTALKDLTQYKASPEMRSACAKKAIDSGNHDLVLTLVKRNTATSDFTLGIVKYAAKKDKVKLLKKIFAEIKSWHQGRYKPEIQALAKSALEEGAGNDQTKAYLKRKAEGKSPGIFDLWRRT
jgi:hypothetical protein